MRQRRDSPGFTEWMLVTLVILGVGFFFYQLYQYAQVRANLPPGLEIAGVEVGELTAEQAQEILTERYINAPIILYHREQPIEISPAEAEFALKFDEMLAQAAEEQQQQDFWAGFSGYVLGRPIDVDPVPIQWSYNEGALRETLQLIANQFDVPALPPQPVASSMSFQYGAPGLVTNIEASLDDVLAALLRPRAREAHLVLEIRQSERPNISLLNTLITNSVQEFEIRSGGVASVMVIDLESGIELNYKANIPMTGMNVLRIPLLVEAIAQLNDPPTGAQTDLLRFAAIDNEIDSANLLLTIIAGQEDGFIGSNLFNENMRSLGLGTTFIACPFGTENENRCEDAALARTVEVAPATAPEPYYQTSAEDIGLLLSMLYHCAESGGGALLAVRSEQFSPAKCQLVLDLLSENNIDSLIEEGVPPNQTVAHRHGWQSDTYGDGAVVWTPGGDYVIVEFLHKPGWLAWEISSPLMADLSQATYNFFNFDDPFLSQ